MADQGNSSKTIMLLIAIFAATVALFGAEAWNRTHRGQPAPATQAAQVTTPAAPTHAPSVPRSQRGERGNGPDHGTKDAQGEIMMNE